jgi:hypothetical protein
MKCAEVQATGDAEPDLPDLACRGEAGAGQAPATWEAGLLEAALQPFDGSATAAVAGAPEVPGFEIISRLGAGASGEVWLAEELATGRTVALKILHRHGVAGTSEELLQREFRILSKLIHPNLVLLFRAITTTDGRQGLSMEWIDGWPLDEWLEQHPDLSLARKLELFRGMVRGVAFLHENGVIHRDLKPANVIVDAHGVAKIVDFGLARLHQEEGASGMDGGSIGVSGTLHFMAPEQAANGKGSRAMPVDVYALGLMLHRMLTGRWLRPCKGTPAETLAQVLQPPPLELGESESRLPRDLQSILRQALEPEPADRYHHARDLEEDLVRFAAKRPVTARKHTFLYLTATLLRRQARRSAVAAGLVLAGLTAGGLIYHRHRAVTERNEANLRSAYTLTSFTLRQLRDELRAATPENGGGPVESDDDLAGAAAGDDAPVPVDRTGELDLRYYQALLADLRAATSEGHARYPAALKSIQPALDLFSELSRESPDDPKRLLDAAQARLTFARLLGRTGRPDAAGEQARKSMVQLDRLATLPGFDPAPLPALRCDALRLLAQEAHHVGDSAGAVVLARAMMEISADLPSGLLVRPENEPMPRLALAASDLVTYAVAAGPEELPEAQREVGDAIDACRAAHERDPDSAPLAYGLAHALHAAARLSLHRGAVYDPGPPLEEAARLLIGKRSESKRSALGLVWDVSRTATRWAGEVQQHPDTALADHALDLAFKFTVHLRRSGIGHDDLVTQLGQLFVYKSRLACRRGERHKAGRPIYLALGLLRPLQLREPDRVPLALLTAATLVQARSLADLPETQWREEDAADLEGIFRQLDEKPEELTPDQRQELDSLRD